MSGITGVLSSQQQDSLPGILKRIAHRGTSSPNIWTGPKASLGACKHCIDRIVIEARLSEVPAESATGKRSETKQETR